jgi:hypothetical protein
VSAEPEKLGHRLVAVDHRVAGRYGGPGTGTTRDADRTPNGFHPATLAHLLRVRPGSNLLCAVSAAVVFVAAVCYDWSLSP